MNKQQLRALAERATQGEWEHSYGEDFDPEQGPSWDGEMAVWRKGADKSRRVNSDLPIADVGYHGSGENDAKYIAAANPATMLELLDEMDALTAQLAAAEAVAEAASNYDCAMYGLHSIECSAYFHMEHKCNCGVRDLIAALSQWQQSKEGK